MRFDDVAIVSIKGNGYIIYLWYIIKIEAINLLQNSDLSKKQWIIIKYNFLYRVYKVSKEVIAFGNIEIGKREFHHCKNLILSEDVDIDKMLISSMVSSSEKNYKYFFGYIDDDFKIKPLHIMPPNMSTYVKSYNGEFLKKYNDIWNKVCNSIKK